MGKRSILMGSILGRQMLNSLKWDKKGLAVAIPQNVGTGVILMEVFANQEAVAETILPVSQHSTVDHD